MVRKWEGGERKVIGSFSLFLLLTWLAIYNGFPNRKQLLKYQINNSCELQLPTTIMSECMLESWIITGDHGRDCCVMEIVGWLDHSSRSWERLLHGGVVQLPSDDLYHPLPPAPSPSTRIKSGYILAKRLSFSQVASSIGAPFYFTSFFSFWKILSFANNTTI